MKSKKEYFLMKVINHRNPNIISFFDSDKDRLERARVLYKEDTHKWNDLYRVDMIRGKPVIKPFTKKELENK